MPERIEINEEKLDKIILSIKKLENALDMFEHVSKEIIDVNEYYGSREWFEDKEKLEKGEIKNIKAGVLSEDAVWNVNEEINELKKKMQKLSLKKLV